MLLNLNPSFQYCRRTCLNVLVTGKTWVSFLHLVGSHKPLPESWFIQFLTSFTNEISLSPLFESPKVRKLIIAETNIRTINTYANVRITLLGVCRSYLERERVWFDLNLFNHGFTNVLMLTKDKCFKRLLYEYLSIG